MLPATVATPLDAERVDHPLLTYYDDAAGERLELTAEELGSWAGRVASLLRECGLSAGSRIAVLLPPHWQTAAVLLGAWSMGVTVSYRSWATAGLSPDAEPMHAVFVSRQRADSWLESIPEADYHFVLELAGEDEFLAELRRRDDSPPDYVALRPSDPASPDGTSYQEWARVAHGLAEVIGLRAGDRVLIDAATHEEPMKWLLAPLVAGASIVLCANFEQTDLDARATAEHVTHVL